MELTFAQVFFEDDIVHSVLNALRSATVNWQNSSLCNETVLLNEVCDALLAVGSNACKSKAYPDLQVSSERTILDRKGKYSRDLFGADLAVTLSLFEGEKLSKQRTALFQLKVGEQVGGESKFLLDIRQIYTVGHNKDSAGRWFIAVCTDTSGAWSFATERQISNRLTEEQLSVVPHSHEADRKKWLSINDEWLSISRWTYDWLAGGVGKDSDLEDDDRIEAVLEMLRDRETAVSAARSMGDDFDDQFASYGRLLPRVHIEYKAAVKRNRSD